MVIIASHACIYNSREYISVIVLNTVGVAKAIAINNLTLNLLFCRDYQRLNRRKSLKKIDKTFKKFFIISEMRTFLSVL